MSTVLHVPYRPASAEEALDPSGCARRVDFPEANGPSAVPFSLFDTQIIEPSLRYDAWRENMSVFFDVTSPATDALSESGRARVAVANLGEAVIGLAEASAQHFVRDNLLVAREEMELILVQFFLKGGGCIPGEERIVAGDMLVIDLSRPHRMVNDDFRNLTLAIPKSLSPELTNLLEQLHSRRIAGDNPLVQFTREHLENLWRWWPTLTREQAMVAVQGTLGLMGGWLGNDPSIQEQFKAPTDQALLAAITRYIDKHLERSIGVAELIQTFHLSRTQLYRLFHPHGGVANFLWERRLRRSLRLLFSPSMAEISLSTIAYRCGFSSESHFSRRFRERFGSTPGKARVEALGLANNADSAFLLEKDHLLPFRRMIEGFVNLLDAPLDPQSPL